MPDCENCKHCHTFETFYDTWKGMQYDTECLCPIEELSLDCAKELGLEKEWHDENDDFELTEEQYKWNEADNRYDEMRCGL